MYVRWYLLFFCDGYLLYEIFEALCSCFPLVYSHPGQNIADAVKNQTRYL